MNFDLKDYLAKQEERLNLAWERLLPAESQYPELIHKAMRYSMAAGGKRLRPVLAIAAAEAVGFADDSLLPAACALECIHTYSLIHDDLPALDDDDLRRGKPTNHKVFGEAMAILAGDALLTHAFQLLAQQLTSFPAERVVQVIAEVASASGTQGMIGGQVVDILSERGELTGSEERALHYIHTHKTGALICASVRVGAILGGARLEQIKALTKYASYLGLAFQITDDLLDTCGDEAVVGKRLNKDAARGKLTYPRLYGLEESKRKNEELLAVALQQLSWFGSEAEPLRAIAKYLIYREK